MKDVFDGARALCTLTIGEFVELIDRRLEKVAANPGTPSVQAPSTHLVYGLRGIQQLFGCSHRTAQFYKDHVIQQAVCQNGRKIVVDADMALKLFNERREK